MANPPCAMTVSVNIPILNDILQSVHDSQTAIRDLQKEIHGLRTEFATRLQVLETQLVNQSANQSLSDTNTLPAQDVSVVDDTILVREDLGGQEEDRANEGLQVQDGLVHDHEDDDLNHGNVIIHEHEHNHELLTQEDPVHDQSTTAKSDLAHKGHDDLNHDDDQVVTNGSSPSVDAGITISRIMIPPSVTTAAAISGNKKRKRTVHDAQARVINSGFIIRGSDAQIAEKRIEDAKGPSRSESPFDNKDDRHTSSDEDVIPSKPPTRKLPSMSQSRAPPRRREPKKAKETGLDEFVSTKLEEISYSRYTGRARTQTKRQPGFVATPQDFED
ncbi:hypothetical protein QM012_000167 [Aureobasidium pullulans]|uniref:Shugoshin C-terminal domain-containing protein n=1 Tax=Aureobasidium pullulans TaxID=5580 RepID=A0ABR0TUX6_AURPU